MYKKTVIRQFFVEYLKTLVAPVEERVYGGRIDPKHKSDDFPYLVVNSKNDEILEYVTGYTEREMDLLIAVTVRDNQTADADFDAIVESLMYEVEKAMSLQITVPSTYENPNGFTFPLFKTVLFKKSQIQNDNSSGNDYGTALMGYTIEYDYEDPVVPLTLNDFDVEGSIQNIQITNQGVPDNV